MNPTPDYPPIRFPAQEIHELRDELALLKAERDELRNALEACIERLIASQPPTGGRTEAVIAQAKAVLAKGNG